MKTLIVALAVIYSSQSMASIVCKDQDQTLTLKDKGRSVEVLLEEKSGGKTHFKGVTVDPGALDNYYKKSYALTGSKGEATLVVSKFFETSELPCHGRRICGSATFNEKITADFDFQGKLTTFACYETGI